MKQNQRGRSPLLATISAVLLGTLAVFGLSAPAGAATGPNINPATTGTITVHKLTSPDVAPTPPLQHNGQQITPAPSNTPIGGVTFKVTKLEGGAALDLTTNAGWTNAKALATQFLGGNTSLGSYTRGVDQSIVTSTTPPNVGTATTTSLNLGVYLVEEIGGGDGVVTRSQPFIVTIPMPTTSVAPGAAGQIWNYDVHVYPKNGVSSVVKSVDDSTAHGLGDTVSWTIKGKIPGTVGTEPITSFKLIDHLDARLAYVPGVTTVAYLDPTAGANIPLTEDTGSGGDYTIATTPTPTTLTFTLTADGRGKLAGAAGGEVVLTFNTTVQSVGDGTIVNRGIVNINDREITSLPVNTRWGKLIIFKHDSADVEKGLEGAKFKVYTQAVGGTAVSVLGVDEFESDEDGYAYVNGLKVGTYWIEETQAPDRYMPTTGRIQVVITATTEPGVCEEEQEDCPPVLVPVEVSVANTKVPDWELPLTGGTALALPILGFGLLLTAAGAGVLAKRGQPRHGQRSRVSSQ